MSEKVWCLCDGGLWFLFVDNGKFVAKCIACGNEIDIVHVKGAVDNG